MNNIIDLHNHTLPGVDDGCEEIKESLVNLEYLKKIGVTDIVLTSHYITDTKYNSSVEARNNILKELKEKNNTGINLYLGNEVFATDSNLLLELLHDKKITTLNNSRYLLIEFAFNQKLNHIDKLLCELNDKNIIPIIAHPERYHDFQNNYEKIYDILEYDCLLQCNLTSISGQYGKNAKKYIKWLLKHDLVTFLATDFHHIPSKKYLTKSLKKLNKMVSSSKKEDLLYNNPKLVLEDIKIDNNYTVLK